MTKKWHTVKETAALLGVSERTVRRYIKRYGWDTTLDTLEGGSVNRRFIRRDDVAAYIADQSDSEDGQADTPDKMDLSRDGTPDRLLDAPITARQLDQLVAALDARRDSQDSEEISEGLKAIHHELSEIRKAQNRRRQITVAVGLLVLLIVAVFVLKMVSIAAAL